MRHTTEIKSSTTHSSGKAVYFFFLNPAQNVGFYDSNCYKILLKYSVSQDRNWTLSLSTLTISARGGGKRYNPPSCWVLCFHWSTKHECPEKKTQPWARSGTSLWRNMNQKHECTLRMCEFGTNIARSSIYPTDGSWHLRSLVKIFKNSWYFCYAFIWTTQRCSINAILRILS